VACGWRAAHVPEVNAVNRVLTFATLLLVLGATPQFAEAQSGGDGMREQFEAIIDGLNENTFRTFHDAIDDFRRQFRDESRRHIHRFDAACAHTGRSGR
jgi:hypothetical protein